MCHVSPIWCDARPRPVASVDGSRLVRTSAETASTPMSIEQSRTSAGSAAAESGMRMRWGGVDWQANGLIDWLSDGRRRPDGREWQTRGLQVSAFPLVDRRRGADDKYTSYGVRIRWERCSVPTAATAATGSFLQPRPPLGDLNLKGRLKQRNWIYPSDVTRLIIYETESVTE